jgi:tetratricopeptide (TPR) repeat protein
MPTINPIPNTNFFKGFRLSGSDDSATHAPTGIWAEPEERCRLAAAYTNLATVLKKRGDLTQAEQMQREALNIFERLGNKEGVATVYNNLGETYQKQNQRKKAREMWTKARDIFSVVGLPDKVKLVQDNLDDFEKKS